jgi:hypothetical protein
VASSKCAVALALQQLLTAKEVATGTTALTSFLANPSKDLVSTAAVL